MVRDFTGLESTSQARVLKDSDRPMLSLRFLDNNRNWLSSAHFEANLQLSIVDNRDVTVSQGPTLINHSTDSDYTVDLCLSNTGVYNRCLKDLTSARLKITDTSASISVIVNLDLIAGSVA